MRAARMEGAEPAMAMINATATTTGSKTGMKTWLAVRWENVAVWVADWEAKMRTPSQAARAEPKR